MKQLYEFIKKSILSSFSAAFNSGAEELKFPEPKETETKSGIRLSSTKDGSAYTIDAVFGEGGIVFSIDADISVVKSSARTFSSENAVNIPLGPAKPDAVFASSHDKPWWMTPDFPKAYEDIKPGTQSLLIKIGALSYHLLPLCGENFRCEFSEGALHISSGKSGLCRLNGPFLAVSVSTDPLAAVKENYRSAKALGAISIPLKEERSLPDHFKKFGWCTWDSFYHDVTSEKIYRKLAEFKEKHIPVKWMIIDDGWMSVTDGRLDDFAEDRTKFPEGLKAAITRIKEEFGVEKVGVWHAFNGYWSGVSERHPFYLSHPECFARAKDGSIIPALDEEKAFLFWDAWHTYLAECGVDFLKVDNQSSYSGITSELMPTVNACRIAHAALERSICKNFGGDVINCMGMDMENVLSRPFTAVSRNSDDFFPRKEHGFAKHMVQNVYSAIWHDQLCFCDFDMWWSEHESAKQSGVLRAISGSPVYVSDEIGKSNYDNIMPVIESDGTVMLCDQAAMPTPDCVFSDCRTEKKLLKVWNRSGDYFALAAFNLSGGEITECVEFSSVPDLRSDTEYIAYEYFSKTFLRINRCEDVTVTLPCDGIAVWSIYPIIHPDEASDEGAYILLGDVSKYVPIASGHKVKRLISELQ